MSEESFDTKERTPHQLPTGELLDRLPEKLVTAALKLTYTDERGKEVTHIFTGLNHAEAFKSLRGQISNYEDISQGGAVLKDGFLIKSKEAEGSPYFVDRDTAYQLVLQMGLLSDDEVTSPDGLHSEQLH